MYEIELTPELTPELANNEDGTFPKKFNADHLRTLQAICACFQICNWSTWCLEIPPNC